MSGNIENKIDQASTQISEKVEQMSGSEGGLMSMVKGGLHKLTDTLDDMRAKFSHPHEQHDEEHEGSQPSTLTSLEGNEGDLPASEEKHTTMEKVMEFIHKPAEKLNEIKERLTKDVENLTKEHSEKADKLKEEHDRPLPKETERSIEEPSKEGIFSSISSKISETVESLKERILPKAEEKLESFPNKESLKAEIKSKISDKKEELSEKTDEILDHIKPSTDIDLENKHNVVIIPKEELRKDVSGGDFIEVKDGFKETVDELKEEIRKEEFGTENHMSNPFFALESEAKLLEGSIEGDKSAMDKLRGGFQDTTSKISDAFSGLKEKIMPSKEKETEESK